MSPHRNACRLAVVALLLAAGSPIHASGKNPEKKKGPTPPLLQKTDELKASDARDRRLARSPCKTYTISLTAGKIYRIDLSSRFFDAYLRLEDAKGKQVAFNDDADASTFDARIVYKAAQTGEYKIIAASADGKLGKFALTVNETDKKAVLLTGSRFAAKAIDLTFKTGKASYRGELVEKDAMALKRYYKVFAIALVKGKTYRFESKADDPRSLTVNLFLEDADGSLLDSSGFSKDGMARIIHKAASAGSYRVIVTTKPAQQVGRFSLEIASE